MKDHSGHDAQALARIAKAREHYQTRAERRPRQAWRSALGGKTPPKGSKGAVPFRFYLDDPPTVG